MAVAAKKPAEPKQSVPNSSAQTLDVSRRRTPELVIAFVGAAGSGVTSVAEAFAKSLRKDFNYVPHKIKVSDFIKEHAKNIGKPIVTSGSKPEQIRQMQDIGNELREGKALRFLDLIFNIQVITPSSDEAGMSEAFAAAASAACLSRQVGAAAYSDKEELLGIGWNDVPRFGGGLYSSDDEIDNRCFAWGGGICHNDDRKNKLNGQIALALKGSNFLAKLCIEKIARWRVDEQGYQPSDEEIEGQKRLGPPLPKRWVHIINELKHPDEVKMLRDVYGDLFWLVAVMADEKSMERGLVKQGMNNVEAASIIKRDENEAHKSGQKVRDTVQLADYFIRNDPDHLKQLEARQTGILKEGIPDFEVELALKTTDIRSLIEYLKWSGRMFCSKHYGHWDMPERQQAREEYRARRQQMRDEWRAWKHRHRWGRPASSGNVAFDEYREETLRRLDEEQREFRDFLDKLRAAKDRAEFDQFMSDRRNRPATEPPPAPSAA